VRSSVWSRVLIAPCVVGLLGGVVASPSVAAGNAQRVKPGAVVTIADVHCRVGLLLHQRKTVYAAVPATCGSLPLNEGIPQWGCGPKGRRQPAASAPVGTPVRITGAQHHATIAYDSFTRMQAIGTKKVNECQFNELILLKLSNADASKARGKTTSVMTSPPASGTPLTLGGTNVTAAASTHNGWVYPLSKAPQVRPFQVGTPLLDGSTQVGMLTAIPQGKVMMTPPAAYNLFRAINIARKTPCVNYQISTHKKFHACFDKLQLLKAGEHL
jgi:hypothetical protein